MINSQVSLWNNIFTTSIKQFDRPFAEQETRIILLLGYHLVEANKLFHNNLKFNILIFLSFFFFKQQQLFKPFFESLTKTEGKKRREEKRRKEKRKELRTLYWSSLSGLGSDASSPAPCTLFGGNRSTSCRRQRPKNSP